MSFNQSRSDKSETQYRKTGRSGSFSQQRGSSGAYGRGSGGPAPSPSISSNRSFKKSNSNAQGGQSRAPNVPTVNSSLDGNASAPRGVQNGAHIQPQLHGATDVPASVPAAKQAEPSAAPRSARGVPKAPTTQHAPVSSDNTATTTPTKTPGDGSKPFLQFGSISPGFMNVMQIPARTNSAPPNLDEQKRDQARQEAFRAAPVLPTPVPKQPQQQPQHQQQQFPRKDFVAMEQPNTPEAHHQMAKGKKDVQVPHAPPASQTQKASGLPMAMPLPFHQSPVSMPFGGPNQQMQSQGVSAGSLQMPMPMTLPIGATQVQQSVLFPGLQPHPMQHQGLMHQGQNLSFTNPMGQLPPQMGNLGMGMGPQYPKQQGGKFSGPPRKTPVKITNPKTHEEVRFDKRTDAYSDGGSSGLRPHPSVPQSQPIPSFAPSHPMNYYTASYNANNIYFPNASTLPLTGPQMPSNSQAARYNYPGNQGPQNVKIGNPSGPSALPINKSGTHVHGTLEPPTAEHSRDVQSSISSAPSGPTNVVTVKSAAVSIGEKVDSLSKKSTTVEKGELPKSSGPSGQLNQSHLSKDNDILTDKSLQQSKSGSDSVVSGSVVGTDQSSGSVSAVPLEGQVSTSEIPSSIVPPESVPVTAVAESRKKESLSRSNSIKDQQKKSVRKGISQSQHQVGVQTVPVSTSPSRTSECEPTSQRGSAESSISDSVESNSTLAAALTNEDVAKATEESLLAATAATADASGTKTERTTDISVSISSESSVLTASSIQNTGLDTSSLQDIQVKHDNPENEQRAKQLSEGPNEDINRSEVSSESNSLQQSIDSNEQVEQNFLPEESNSSGMIPSLEVTREGMDEPESSSREHDLVGDKVTEDPCAENSSSTDASLSGGDIVSEQVSVSKSGKSNQQSSHSIATEVSKHEGGSTETVAAGESTDVSGVSVPAGTKDKPLPELTRSKSSTSRGKKKRRECLLRADAAGTTSDLYMAYKSPDENKESPVSSGVTESTSSSINSKQTDTDLAVEDAAMIEKDGGKAEPDNWEDVADISKPKLETEDDGAQAHGGIALQDRDGGNMVKKYSRDFLLKFSEQFTEVPEIPPDIAEVLMSPHANASRVDRSPFPSPGRIIDRPQGGTPRLDRRNSGVTEDDRWNKMQPSFGAGRMDLGFGPNPGFRTNQGGNYGVLRNPRAQTPVQYIGGILSGPMQSVGSQGGMQRNSPDADRWQRAANFQHKGLIPSPQTPLVTMHKTERRYEVGKVTDEEEAKQRQLKAILNKLTPQNFEKLFEQVKVVNIDNARTLRGVIAQIFDKALTEPTFCEMYANFCFHLSGELPDFSEDNEKITFKRLLLNKCQEEFERGEREQEEANKADEEGEVKQSPEEREEKRVKARRRMLGNIRLIGELFKKKMLTERIMHECIKKLLGQHQTPDEEDVEALCKLMSTIGESIDHPKAKEHMDAYFDGMKALSNNMKLSSRVRFMLKDSIDLRKNHWQQRRKVEGPKKIEEVHRDAAQERQAQTSRLARGPGNNSSGRRGPADFGPRGSSMLSPSNSQMGSFRQARGFGSQDVRYDEKQQPLVPLTQRAGEDITLGPQGGLARGMSIRGSPLMSPVPLTDMSSSTADSRRGTAVVNGYSSVSERAYSPREDPTHRFVPDKFSGQVAYDQSSAQERNIYGGRDLGNSDPNIDSRPPSRGQGSSSTQSTPAEKALPEKLLREKSSTLIKEFYSARLFGEAVLCIKELNSPSFHPTMVSMWVTDSFDAKDMERALLVELLVHLTTSSESTLNRIQLVKGFESVLETLEETVTDAPRAPLYLGRIFANLITQNVVSLGEIGKLIHQGGEEPGSLLSSGLAGDVLGNVLDIIKSEKGEDVLKELVKGSSLQLETFRPPGSLKSQILEKFI